MAIYENQSDMFNKRAEKNKKDGDRYYAQAMNAKADGDNDNYDKYMAQAQYQYNSEKDNRQKAKEHAGKNW